MSEAIAIPEHAPALVPWAEMAADRRAMLKQVCGGVNLNDAQFGLLMEVAIRSGLDPFRKQLYGLIIKGRFVIVTGIDGFRGVAARNGHVGTDDAKHTYDENDTAQRFPRTSTVTVRRLRNGVVGEYTATARWHEYARTKVNDKGVKVPDGNWLTMPHTMLDKCAEALALRKAFTETLGGLYERDELNSAGRAEQVRPSSAKELLAPAPEPEQDDAIDVDGYEDEDPTAKDAP
ncbi:MAG: phage recombination protein Bet [Phycicoccus sp.]